MRDFADSAEGLPSMAPQARRRALASQDAGPIPHAPTIPMDTFRWIVSGLLGALVIGVGWFLAGIQTDLRDVRREMTGMRVESAVTNTKLEELIAEFRRRDPR